MMVEKKRVNDLSYNIIKVIFLSLIKIPLEFITFKFTNIRKYQI